MTIEVLLPCPFCGERPGIAEPFVVHPENGCILAGYEFGDWHKDEAEAITAWNTRAPAVSEEADWQPIETAPKDGTPILLFGPHEDISVAKWGPGWSCLADGRHAIAYQSDFGTEYIDFSCPTHWMPLPEPPTE